MQKSIRVWVWLADMLVLVVFAAIGRQSHAESNPLGAILATAAPFALTWSVVGYLAGVLAPLPRWEWLRRTLLANVVSCAIALVVRALWLQRPDIPWTFALITFGVTTLFLLGTRLVHRNTEATL